MNWSWVKKDAQRERNAEVMALRVKVLWKERIAGKPQRFEAGERVQRHVTREYDEGTPGWPELRIAAGRAIGYAPDGRFVVDEGFRIQAYECDELWWPEPATDGGAT